MASLNSSCVAPRVTERRPLKDGAEIRIEEELDASNRVDIVLHFGTRLLIAVENKVTSPLLPNQLHRYAEVLHYRADYVILALLAPSQYELSQVHVPKALVVVVSPLSATAPPRATCPQPI